MHEPRDTKTRLITEETLRVERPHLAFGTKLRQAREEEGFRLCELADELGVSVPFMSDVEKGRRPLSEDRIRKAAKFLGADLMPLLEAATKDRGKIVLEVDDKLDPRVLRAITLLSMNWPSLPRATVKHLLGEDADPEDADPEDAEPWFDRDDDGIPRRRE